ncbi:hypothetical protein SUGI_0493980 [Cryptomeria japonica]|nr:hypothetical protein SUGI_0493980 [Cryptomeria japonica]
MIIRRNSGFKGLDHVVGMLRGLDLELLHMRLGNLGIEAMDLLCLDHWLRPKESRSRSSRHGSCSIAHGIPSSLHTRSTYRSHLSWRPRALSSGRSNRLSNHGRCRSNSLILSRYRYTISKDRVFRGRERSSSKSRSGLSRLLSIIDRGIDGSRSNGKGSQEQSPELG